MDLPTYIKNPDKLEVMEQNYHEELNQTLRDNLGPNGTCITNISATDLSITPVLDPTTGQFTTIKDLMPVGTIWFETDLKVWVGKRQASPSTVLVQFTTAPYP
jgi:hypothetical protein